MSVNKVILIGNIGTDPEIKRFDNNGKLARFSLATSSSYKNRNGERIDKTQWHNIVVKGGAVDFIEKYCFKGNRMYLEGFLEYREWENKEGQKQYITEVVCMQVQNLTPKSTGQSNQNASTSQAVEAAKDLSEDGDDDLPF